MSKRWFTVNKKETEDSGSISLYNDIGLWGISMQDFETEFARVEAVDNLTVRINSYGGEVFVGLGIRNRLSEHKAKNKTIIIDGVAASIASVIAVTPGFKLSVYKNAFFMVHKPSVMVAGNADDLRKEADLLDKIQTEIMQVYREKTKGKLSEDELNKMINDETWLTGKELYDLGIADILIDEDAENDEPETNSIKKLPDNLKKVFLNNYKPISKGDKMNTCPHCGKNHADGAVFCNHCGDRIVALTTTQVVSKAEKDELITAERMRISSITNHCSALNLPQDFISSLIVSGETLDEASEKITSKIQELKPLVPVSMSISISADEKDKYRNQATLSISNAIGLKIDAKDKEDIRKNPGPTDIHGLVRRELLNEGKMSASVITQLSANDLATQAMRLVKNAVGSSDLPSILADTMNKTFVMTPTEAGATFDQICAVDETPDFRTKTYAKLSAFGDIDLVPEGAKFKQGSFSDAKEQMTLNTYGKMLCLTRQLITNNDTMALSLFPQKIMRAIYGKANRVCYDLLVSNALAGPTLLEGGALFAGTKGNLLTSKGVVSVSAINELENAISMTKLLKGDPKDPDSFVTGGIKKILAGTLSKLTTLQVLNSVYDPNSAKNANVFNPYNTGITPVFDSYLQSKLTAASAGNAYYGFADPAQFPTLTALYLQGNRTPSVRSEPSGVGESQGISYEFYYDIAFGFQCWRGIVYSDGK